MEIISILYEYFIISYKLILIYINYKYEINCSTLKYLSWASSNIIKCQQCYSISSIEEHVIRCTCLICHFKGGIPLPVFPEIMSGNVCYKVHYHFSGLPSYFPANFRKYSNFKWSIYYNLQENHFLANIY